MPIEKLQYHRYPSSEWPFKRRCASWLYLLCKQWIRGWWHHPPKYQWWLLWGSYELRSFEWEQLSKTLLVNLSNSKYRWFLLNFTLFHIEIVKNPAFHKVTLGTLNKYSDTLLGSHVQRSKYFLEDRNEYFFERNRLIFRFVVITTGFRK